MLFRSAHAHGPDPVAAVLDARRGEVYAAGFAGGRAADWLPEAVIAIEDLAARLPAGCRLIGEGAPLCRENYFPTEYDPVHMAEHAGSAIALGTTDQFFEDASFAKLREVSATFTFPEKWVRSRMSLTLAGRELHTWTKYSGVDPEANQNAAATTALQQEQAVTPPLTRFLATLNVTW